MQILFINPPRRLYFQRLNQLADGFGRMHPDEQVDVVGRSVDGMDEMLLVSTCPSEVAVQFLFPRLADERFPPANGENNVHVDLGVCVGHLSLWLKIMIK